MSEQKPHILVAVLNWGLGHASRILPVIYELEKQGVVPIVASDGRALTLLEKEVPHLRTINLKSKEVFYPDSGSMAFSMMQQTPKILKNIWREHTVTQRLVKQYKLKGIISDNRFGMWSKSVPSVFLTHQVFIQVPSQWQWLEPSIYKINHFFIGQYKWCWIPDFPNSPNLSGKLAHGRKLDNKRFRFIGPLSRLKKQDVPFRYDLMVLLSGPEPQRSLLEKKLLEQLENYDGKTVFVRGVTETNEVKEKRNLTIFDHLTSEKINQLMNESRLIIGRSGYSSLMDLVTLEKNAILIPTSGQTEQEYLAAYFKANQIFNSYPQNEFDLTTALQESYLYTGWNPINDHSHLLSECIGEFLDCCK